MSNSNGVTDIIATPHFNPFLFAFSRDECERAVVSLREALERSTVAMDRLRPLCEKLGVRLAVENGVRTIAFPAISTGVYRFPPERACSIAVRTVREFVAEEKTIEKATFACFDAKTYQLYLQRLGGEE